MAETDINDSSLPYNIDAEQIVLGSILVEPELLSKVNEILTPEHFHVKMQNSIYSVMQMLFGKGEDVNIVTVTENCIRNSVFDSQESARTYLFKLSEMSVEKSSIESYAEILDETREIR